MILIPDSWGVDLVEYNKCHNPAGSSEGGRFCSQDAALNAVAQARGFRDKYELYDKGSSEDAAALGKARKAWNTMVAQAVSAGVLDPVKARDQLGWSLNPAEDYKPLPPVLYHVTTAAEAVHRKGLKTRDELTMDLGAGLGGGASDTVSFTDDLKVARAIQATMLEAQRVARGEITVDQMLATAKRSPLVVTHEAADESVRGMDFYSLFVRLAASNSDWRKGQPLPLKFEQHLRGDTGLSYDEEKQFPLAVVVDELPAGVMLAPGATTWMGGDGKLRSNRGSLIRKMTEDERREQAFEIYKSYIFAREIAGGRMNPLFFLSDPKALAKLRRKDIKILQFAPRKGARGYQVSSLGEWRTHTGRAVKLTGVVESAQ